MSRAKGWLGFGGYIPSIMGGILRAGPYFMTASLSQGARLIHNNKHRMRSRKGSRRSYSRRTRRRHK